MEPYTYRPLLPAKHSIRLIQILPGLPGTEIHCRIIDYTIRNDRISGLFEALSYVWGDTKDLRRIFVADLVNNTGPDIVEGYLEITSNLHIALEELRDPTLPRTMWIDAVCINQGDLDERASQVAFMAKIYSYAIHVVVWLGPEDGHTTTHLFAAIKDAAEVARHPVEPPTSSRSERCETVDSDAFLESALNCLLSRPWFSRVWVLQEAAAARILIVRCGCFELRGEDFANGVKHLQAIACHQDEPTRDLGSSVLNMMKWDISTLNRPYSNHLADYLVEGQRRRAPPLGDLIEKFYLHGVSDRRDTVFALLNLCDPESRRSVEPDYTKPWPDIWTQTIREILGPDTIVTVFPGQDQAYMTMSGYVLGSIRQGEDKSFYLSASMLPFLNDWDSEIYWKADISREPWCKSIQEHDIVFLAAGAEAPSIIRACGDHFDIIVIALASTLAPRFDSYLFNAAKEPQPRLDWQEMLMCIKHRPRRVTLIWDWCSDYPSSCGDHSSRLEKIFAYSGSHPDRYARMEDFLHTMASLNTIVFSHDNRSYFDYIVCHSEEPGFPSNLKSKLQVLMLFLFGDSYWTSWLKGQFEFWRKILWMVTHRIDSKTWSEVTIDYLKGEGCSPCNIFDMMSIYRLEVRLRSDGSGCGLRLADTSDAISDRYFSNLFWEAPSGVQWSAEKVKYGIKKYLCAAILRYSGVTLDDFHSSIHSLLSKPLIQLPRQDDRQSHRCQELSINVRALALLFTCQGSCLTLSQSELRLIIAHPHALGLCICVFSYTQMGPQAAYRIISAIISLEPDGQSMSLYQRLCEALHFAGEDMDNADSWHNWYFYTKKLSGGFGYAQWTYQDAVNVFVKYHFKTLLWYIESTEILEIAATTTDDNFLPFLRNLLGLDSNRILSLQDYRKQWLAQLPACTKLPKSSREEDDFLYGRLE